MSVWQFIISKKQPCILLYVLQSIGSSPGRQGFKMAVSADGQMCGSIGGGIMEHKFVEMAKDLLQKNETASRLYRQLHDKEAGENKSGMICSGEQSIFIYSIRNQDIEPIEQLAEGEAAFQNGALQLGKAGIAFSQRPPQQNYFFEQEGDDFLYMEKTGCKNQLHIIGGGHCALALSRIMRGMDFYIRVYDEREGLNTIQQNEYAHEKIIVDTYSAVNDFIPAEENVYVVIMTFGYRTDDRAIRSLLNRNFKYCGVLGSANKMKKLKEAYAAENLSGPLLLQLYSPIGISINSQTPEEIAVSIAAEMIKVKNA
ncbi:MAG: XdhC family protein [Ferruginibacter sp.]